MRYKGKVENGLVRIVDAHLPDGAEVTVTLETPFAQSRRLGDFMDKAYFDESYAGELRDLLDQVMQERESSLQLEMEQEQKRRTL
jgi:hypothetical protein